MSSTRRELLLTAAWPLPDDDPLIYAYNVAHAKSPQRRGRLETKAAAEVEARDAQGRKRGGDAEPSPSPTVARKAKRTAGDKGSSFVEEEEASSRVGRYRITYGKQPTAEDSRILRQNERRVSGAHMYAVSGNSPSPSPSRSPPPPANGGDFSDVLTDQSASLPPLGPASPSSPGGGDRPTTTAVAVRLSTHSNGPSQPQSRAQSPPQAPGGRSRAPTPISALKAKERSEQYAADLRKIQPFVRPLHGDGAFAAEISRHSGGEGAGGSSSKKKRGRKGKGKKQQDDSSNMNGTTAGAMALSCIAARHAPLPASANKPQWDGGGIAEPVFMYDSLGDPNLQGYYCRSRNARRALVSHGVVTEDGMPVNMHHAGGTIWLAEKRHQQQQQRAAAAGERARAAEMRDRQRQLEALADIERSGKVSRLRVASHVAYTRRREARDEERARVMRDRLQRLQAKRQAAERHMRNFGGGGDEGGSLYAYQDDGYGSSTLNTNGSFSFSRPLGAPTPHRLTMVGFTASATESGHTVEVGGAAPSSPQQQRRPMSAVSCVSSVGGNNDSFSNDPTATATASPLRRYGSQRRAASGANQSQHHHHQQQQQQQQRGPPMDWGLLAMMDPSHTTAEVIIKGGRQ